MIQRLKCLLGKHKKFYCGIGVRTGEFIQTCESCTWQSIDDYPILKGTFLFNIKTGKAIQITNVHSERFDPETYDIT